MRKKIDLVSHCWAQKHPHYAAALTYQLSSLVLHKPEKCEVRAVICYCPTDKATLKVLGWFNENTSLDLFLIPLKEGKLGRRSIGRNASAQASTADFVWFADVDQVYRDGILDRLAGFDWPDKATMIYPKKIWIHRDHVTGDKATSKVTNNPQLVDIHLDEFTSKRYDRAIGGVQIVKGDFARKYGYLGNTPKWQRSVYEVSDGKMFGDFRDDVVFRTHCKLLGNVQGVNLPGLYRLRHTQTTHR